MYSPGQDNKNLERPLAIIYQTTNMGDAQVRIAFVDRGNADLLVHRVTSPGLARGDGLWFVTRDRRIATVTVYFTSVGMAQLKICFVDSDSEVGWQVPRPRHIQL